MSKIVQLIAAPCSEQGHDGLPPPEPWREYDLGESRYGSGRSNGIVTECNRQCKVIRGSILMPGYRVPGDRHDARDGPLPGERPIAGWGMVVESPPTRGSPQRSAYAGPGWPVARSCMGLTDWLVRMKPSRRQGHRCNDPQLNRLPCHPTRACRAGLPPFRPPTIDRIRAVPSRV